MIEDATATTPVRPRMKRILPPLAAAVTVLLWASAFVAIRYVGRELSAGPLSLARLLVGSAALGVVLLLRRRRAEAGGWPRGRAWWWLAVCGVVWFGIYNIALNEAERRVDAGTAAMLVGVGPLLIAVLAGLVLREGFPRRLLIGCAVSFAGVVVIGATTASPTGVDPWGAALCLVSALAYAVGVTSQKPVLATVSALRATWLACTIGALVCVPFAPVTLRELGTASAATAAWVVYLGVFPTAVAFTTWAYALARTTAGRLGATTYLVPPLAVGLGWVLLGEVPALPALLGGAVCLLGVYVARGGR